MKICFTSRHLEATPALRRFTQNKLGRIAHYAPRIQRIDVVLDIEKFSQTVEASVHVAGDLIFARAEHADMYSAVNLLVDKLVVQIKKLKDKATSHQRDLPAFPEQETDAGEITHETRSRRRQRCGASCSDKRH